MKWFFPLRHFHGEIPTKNDEGAFGVQRKYDIHTGVDLYCAHGNEVFAVEEGTVVNIELFTGPKAGSDWWNETFSVLVEGDSGVVCYGEIEPNPNIKIGSKIQKGSIIGNVLTVLKRYKGKPTAMLHLELYDKETRESTWWKLKERKPKNLKDPTKKLEESLKSQEITKS